MLATPASIVFQATVADAVTDSDYAEIEFDAPSIGAYTDIKPGMTVLVHSNSSDIDSLVFPPTYARKAADSDRIYIGWQATDLSGDDTITVLDDYRLHVRQVRTANNTVYLDYDETWSALPPAIYGLQSVYVEHSSSATILQFRPTFEAMAAGASIDTISWDAGDGSFENGTSSSDQDVDIEFPAWSSGPTSGWRWVSVTVTDDNGNSTTFNFQVFVGNLREAAWVIRDARRIDVGSTIEQGLIASLAVGSSSQNFYTDQHITIAIVEDKNGDSDPIVNNILFVGRLKNLDDTFSVTLDQQTGAIPVTKATAYEVQGYSIELALLPMPEYQLVFSDAASDWNEVTDLSIARAIWYVLIHLTTAATVIAFDLDTSRWNDYQNNGFAFENGTVLESVNEVAKKVGARLIFARAGAASLLKDARLEGTSERDALTTVVDLIAYDLLSSIQTTVPPQPRIGRVEATGATFNTSAQKGTFLRGIAPKIPNTLGESVRQVEFLLESDPDDTNDTVAELAELTANTLAMQNEAEQIPGLTLRQGYWWMVAHIALWITIAFDEFQSGTEYTSSDRWLLESISLSIEMIEDETGAIHQQWRNEGSLTKETSDQGIANSIVWAPEVQPYDIPQVSLMGPYNSNYDPANSYADSASNSVTTGTGSGQGQQTVQPPDATPTPTLDKDVISVPSDGTTVTMNKTTIDGETYKVTVSGKVIVEYPPEVTTVTFDPGGYDDYDLQDSSVLAAASVKFTGASGQVANRTRSNLTTACNVRVDMGSEVTVTALSFLMFGTNSSNNVANLDVDYYFQYTDALGTILYASGYTPSPHGKSIVGGNPVTVGEITDSQTIEGCRYVTVIVRTNAVVAATNNAQIDNISVSVDTQTSTTYADGFFEIPPYGVPVPLGASRGIYVQDVNVPLSNSSPPEFNPATMYSFYMTGTGVQEELKFVDTDYSDNSGNLTVCVEGEFA